jgi:hypothetical protein
MKKNAAESIAPTIRIIYRGECPKLTPRGQGTLSYEFGLNDDELFIRIAANSQGGTCSFEWIPLKTIESLLEDAEESFPAVIFRKAFISRSANNHGYLAAILKAVKVIGVSAEQPANLTFLSFDSIKDQLSHLKDEDLPDLVAAARKEREAKKQAKKVEPAIPVDKPEKKVRAKKDIPPT